MTNPTPQEEAAFTALQIRKAINNLKSQKAQVVQEIAKALQNPQVQSALGEADLKEARDFMAS